MCIQRVGNKVAVPDEPAFHPRDQENDTPDYVVSIPGRWTIPLEGWSPDRGKVSQQQFLRVNMHIFHLLQSIHYPVLGIHSAEIMQFHVNYPVSPPEKPYVQRTRPYA